MYTVSYESTGPYHCNSLAFMRYVVLEIQLFLIHVLKQFSFLHLGPYEGVKLNVVTHCCDNTLYAIPPNTLVSLQRPFWDGKQTRTKSGRVRRAANTGNTSERVCTQIWRKCCIRKIRSIKKGKAANERNASRCFFCVFLTAGSLGSRFTTPFLSVNHLLTRRT